MALQRPLKSLFTSPLKQSVIADPDRAYETVAREYRQRLSAEWLRPFGFNNTYAITVRKPDAASRKLRTISDLIAISGTVRAGVSCSR